MLKKITKEIKDNKNYIFFAYTLAFFTMLPQIVATYLSSQTGKHMIFLIITLFLLMAIAKFSKILFAAFIAFINLTNLVIGHIFFHWGYTYADISARFDVAAISPKSETIEYLHSYFNYRDILLILYTTILLYALFKYITKTTKSFKVLKYLSLISTVAVLAAITFYKNPLKKIEPFSLPYEYKMAYEGTKLYNLRSKNLKHLTCPNNPQAPLYNKIVFIQGEAVNKNHMAIYGYNKKTTPFLTKLQKENKLYIFNAIAPTNQTRYSVPIMHTKADVNGFTQKFINSKADIGKFSCFGYKTYWLSNQGSIGSKDNNIASIATEANVTKFANFIYAQAKTDQVLLNYLNSIQEHSNKEYYVLHLIGSHANYEQRYPKKSALFKNPNTIEQKYDNTIYYTDYIIQNIFAYFKTNFPNQKILIIYVSDHGEVISHTKYGHGFLPPFKDEYEVPFVLFSNIQNPRIEELYNQNKKGYFNLENLNYIVEYINNLRDTPKLSFSSKVISLKPSNIFDYSKLLYYKAK